MAGLENSWQEDEGKYRAFLLRCWFEDQPGDLPRWRFMLVQVDKDPQTKGFACLEELVDYLHGQLSQAAAGTESPLGNSVHQLKYSPDKISEGRKECE